MKHLWLISFALLFFSCDDKDTTHDDDNYLNVTIDPRLPKDDNGFYHLILDRSKWQTIHRIDGKVVDQNDNPVDVVRFEWSSNLYWLLGDTLGYIIKRGLTDQLVYVSYDTTYITGFGGMEVPTINPASYSNSDGNFSQTSGFVKSMIGDTANIVCSVGASDLKQNQMKFSIVLD